MPKKTNPRRVPVTTEDQKTEIRHKVIKRCWIQLFSVLADKHGFTQDELSQCWEASIKTSERIVKESPSFNVIISELLSDGIEPRKVLFGPKNCAENVRKTYEAKAYAIIFYTLKTNFSFDGELLRAVWRELKSSEESRIRGYVKDSDLVEALFEEQRIRLKL